MIEIDYAEIEARARAKGYPFAVVLRRAEIDYKTWWFWKNGRVDPLGRINRVLAEVEKLEAK